ncbi:RILP-like protein 1 isoform X2 [Pungitius pungitius]
MDTTRRLKRRVDAKETEERELTERLQSQQQAAERLRHDLKLQHGCEMKELQRRLEDLQSDSEALANKSRQQQELKQRLDLLVQQRSDRETKTKLLVGHNKKLEAAIDCWKREAEPERRRKIADREKEIDGFTETKTVRILQSDRAAHVKRLEELSFLLGEKVTLLRERDVLRDQMRDHCSERDRWKTDVMKNAKELFSCKKDFGQMQNECQRLRAELKDCSSAYEDVLARKVTLKGLLAAASERSCQQTAEAARLGAELQRESREGGRLQAVREEGVVLLRHVLTDSEEASETEQMMLRLLDILESSAPPKGTRLHPKPLPRRGRERTDPETSQL